ncbi:MAG: hypothetical protein IPM35_01585 [Myxococcales bacterium]|nr:hypothetical protein [Myxococcales bacterium]
MGRVRVIVALSLLSACKDPTRVERAEALGPDTGPYEEGPNHRAGFPCTWCHSAGSTAESHFDIAGTVFARASTRQALPDVRVRLFDQDGDEVSVRTNVAGNFFLREGELAPVDFPIWIQLEYQGEVTAMQTPIFRERSCAGCHRTPPSPQSPGHIYVWEAE